MVVSTNKMVLDRNDVAVKSINSQDKNIENYE